MRIFFLFFLVSSFISGSCAFAESVPEIHSAAIQAITTLESDVSYLFGNVDKCTRHGDQIKKQLLEPLKSDLAFFRTRLDSACGAFVLAKGACKAPSVAELVSMGEVAGEVRARIQKKLDISTTPQSELMGMSGDQVMDLALAADPAYPDCPADDPQDDASTKQLKTYNAMKKRFIALQSLTGALADESENLQRGRGEKICKRGE